jgi:hypothetical protein
MDYLYKVEQSIKLNLFLVHHLIFLLKRFHHLDSQLKVLQYKYHHLFIFVLLMTISLRVVNKFSDKTKIIMASII